MKAVYKRIRCEMRYWAKLWIVMRSIISKIKDGMENTLKEILCQL